MIALAVLVALEAPRARGDTGTVVWTSTADLDGGDKGDPGNEFFAENGVDQARYSWISHPTSQYVAATGRTYHTWLGDSTGDVFVNYYDHAVRTWSATTEIATCDTGTDSHGAPVVFVSSTGRVHVFACAHDEDLQYWRSTNFGGDISAFTAQTDPDTVATYPNVFEYGTTLYLMYRNAAAAGGDWAFRKSTNDGTSWAAEVSLIDMGVSNGVYWGGPELRGDRLYFAFVKFLNTGTLRQDVFACYLDLTSDTAFGLGGTNLGATIDATEADASCRLRDVSGTTQNFWSRLDVLDDRPYLVWHEGSDSGTSHTHSVYYARWTGSAWTTPAEITTTDGLSNYADLIARAAGDVEVFLTGSGFNHNCSGDCEYSGDLERWTFDGSSWARAETIMSEKRSGRPVNHPYVPLNARDDLLLVFDQFENTAIGPAAAMKIYAWGRAGFVYGSGASGTQGVETNTDNANVGGGSFALASGTGDEFATSAADADTYKWTFVQDAGGTASCTRSLTGSVLSLSWTETGGGSGSKHCSVRGNFGVTGDFDVRAKFVYTDENDAGTLEYGICVLDIADACNMVAAMNFAGSDGVGMYFLPDRGGGVPAEFDLLRTWDISSGVITQLGTDTTVNEATTLYMRIARSSATFTSYRSLDGSAWTQDEQTTKAGLTGAMVVELFLFANAVTTGTASIEVDDYELAAGAADADGYRRPGSWASPLQSDRIPEFARVEFTGGSAVDYVDRAEIVDSADAILYADPRDVSVSDAEYTFPFVEGTATGSWRLRVWLRGDGDSSPTVTTVTLGYSTAVPPHPGPNAITFSCTAQYVLPFKSLVRCVPDATPEQTEFEWYVNGELVTKTTVLEFVVDNPQPLVGTVYVHVSLNAIFLSVTPAQIGISSRTLALDFRPNVLPWGFLGVLLAIAFAIAARPVVIRRRGRAATRVPKVVRTKAGHATLHQRGIPHRHR